MLKQIKSKFPNLNYGEMRKACSTKPDALASMYGLKLFETPSGRYWFKDNGANILAVAHLDSVLPFMHFTPARLRMDTLIYCTTLDDRLGVYLIGNWLQKAGVNYDILFTENEERGASTAFEFVPPEGKDYNWMFMFDRAGSDVALYGYTDPFVRSILIKHDLVPVSGSYSCIADMEDIGCKGFNFGCGYHGNHGEYAYASRNELLKNLRKFLRFYKEYKDVKLEHKVYTSSAHEMPHQYNVFDELPSNKLINKIASTKISSTAKEKPLGTIKGIASEDKTVMERIYGKDLKTNTPNESTISSLLKQEISFLPIPLSITQKLLTANFFTIAEVCQKTKVQLLNQIRGLTKTNVDIIGETLEKFSLGFAMNVEKYGIVISEFTPVEVSLGTASAHAISLKKVVKEKNHTSNASVVIHPLPLTLKSAQRSAKAIAENGHSVSLQDQCVRCGENFEIPLDGEPPKELVCPKCQEEKVHFKEVFPDTTPEEKHGVLAAMPLTRSNKDHYEFQITEKGGAWVNIFPVGFCSPVEKTAA
jgi:hypothetical protein